MFNKKKKQKQSLGRVGRVEQEQRYNRIIQIATISVVALVLVVTVGGIILNTLIIPSTTIVTIDGQEIKTSEFQRRVHFERFNLVQTYALYTNYLSFTQDVNTQQQIYGLLQSIEVDLDKETIGQRVMNQMIDEVFLLEEAAERGITVSDQEVEENFNNYFSYSPDGVLSDPSPTAVPTATLSPTQLALITPTPTDGEEPGISPDPAAPVPTSVTAEEFETQKSDFFDQLKEFNVDEAFFRNLIYTQIVRDKLNENLAAGITIPQQDRVWARHILIQPEPTEEGDETAAAEANTAAEATAQDLLDQINNGTAEFGDVAAQYNPDSTSATGGDLGWFGRGQMVPDFEEAAFSGEIGDVVGPVETQFGYHLIQILGKDTQVDQNTFDNLVNSALADLLNQYKEQAEIQFADNWISRTPVKPDVISVIQAQQ
jgi:parvulin-like peptidyl-prolyl isomerase